MRLEDVIYKLLDLKLKIIRIFKPNKAGVNYAQKSEYIAGKIRRFVGIK